MAASALALIMPINSLPNGRSATSNACGHTTCLAVRYGESPSAFAASNCPFGTEDSAPRMISDW